MGKETTTSIFILIVLVAIGAGVFSKQFYFNPAVLSIQQVTPEGTEPLKSGGPSSDEAAIQIPEGMAPMTLPERFNPDTLYEKINGKAELYLSAGFKNLFCRRMKSEKNPDFWMEVFIYEMNNDTNAFAVYSRQRRNDGIALDIAEFSYRTENAVFFTHGPYYVEVIGSTPADELLQYMYGFADRFIKNVPVSSKSKTEFELFPKEGLVPKSISVIPSNAFGYEKLDNIFVAIYELEEKQATLFISNRKTPKHAEDLASGYSTFLTMFDGKNLEHRTGIESAILIEIFGTYELFFTKGPYFCGVHESEDIETAEKMAVQLYESMNSKTHGKQ